MMPRIEEIKVEPSKIYVSSTFKLKIKARRYLNYEDIKTMTYSNGYLRFYSYGYLKGE